MFCVAFFVGMYLKYFQGYDTGYVRGHEAKKRRQRRNETKERRLAFLREKGKKFGTSSAFYQSTFGSQGSSFFGNGSFDMSFHQDINRRDAKADIDA
jgi:hypothetical protein